MDKVMLKAFTLAATAIAPHLIALDPKAVEVKQIDTVRLEHHGKAPTEQFVSVDSEAKDDVP